ncbi:MAG: nucleotide exchange factor GrpE [Bacteroidales bacterium]|nr:nucleotide exchange factor GrpE [Bacteroidales bacterium]
MAHKDTQLKDKKQQDAAQDTEARVEDVLDEYPEAADDRAIEDLAAEELNENDKLKQELDDTKAALEKEKKEYLFLMADFDNYRKRVLKEKQELIKNGAEKALSGLLPVVDDFERGLKASENVEDAKAVREGMELIYQKFVKYLADNGVKAMDTAPGVDFDTDLHDAITTIPAPAPELKGKIVDTTQKGYMLNDKVLRHAKVVVGE